MNAYIGELTEYKANRSGDGKDELKERVIKHP